MMRTIRLMHLLPGILLLLACKCASAQNFIVTLKGDTLVGNVKLFASGPDRNVQVSGSDKKKQTFKVFQVKAVYLNDETYHPVKGPNGYTFMKLIQAGYLSLYGFQPENQTSYDGRFLVKRDGRGTEVPNLGFKKVLKNFLSDCEDVSNKIEAGEYAKKDLTEIIKKYNECIGKNTATPQLQVTKRIPPNDSALKPWDELEEKVKSHTDFTEKQNVLEMIAEIKSKVSRSERVPNFLIQGLTEALPQPEFTTELTTAIENLNK